MAYTMIAERGNQTMRKQRDSALIVLANARCLQNEGWQVVIRSDDGKDVDLGAFAASLPQTVSSWFTAAPQQTEPAAAVAEATDTAELVVSEAEAAVAAALAAEAGEADEQMLQHIDETDFDDLDDDGAEPATPEHATARGSADDEDLVDEIAREIATVG